MLPQSSNRSTWARWGLLALATLLLVFILHLEAPIFTKTSHQDISTKQADQPIVPTECSPVGIHIAQGGDVIDGLVGMTVSFLIRRECNVSVYKPTVHYQKDEDEEAVFDARPQASKSGSYRPNPISYKYKNDRKEISYTSDWIYHIELPNLEAATPYWYQIVITAEVTSSGQDITNLPETRKPDEGHSKEGLHARSLRRRRLRDSRWYKFYTPPLPGSPVSIAVVGDMGYSERSISTMTNIRNDDVSQVIIVGDVSYAGARWYRWMIWLETMQPLLLHKPLTVAAGNHEIECDDTNLSVFNTYENLFHNPNYKDAVRTPISPEYKETLHKQECTAPTRFETNYQYGNSFFAYTHGLLRVVVLNSYSDCTPGSIQFEWLTSTLSSIDRSVTPWVMVVMHAPIYDPFRGHRGELFSNKAAMELVFNEFGINIVVSGHDHAYSRTHPVRHGELDERAPVYVIAGTGGSWEGPPSEGYVNKMIPEPWIASRRLETTGYGHLEIHNATHALWDYRSNRERQVWDWNMSAYAEDSASNKLLRLERGRDVGGNLPATHQGEAFRDTVWLTNPHHV